MSEDSSLSEEQRRMLAGTGPRRLGCWITIVVVVVILAVAAWIFRAVYLPAASASAGGPPGMGGSGSGKRNHGGTAQPVVMTPATRRDVDITLDALGTVTPLATVTVRTQIAGNLTQIAFTEGQTVKAGDFLAEVDPRPYQLALDQYQGQVERDQALLTQAKADLARYQTLAQQDSIAQQQVDASTALVGQYQGDLVVDQAQIGTAKLNLAYCHIVAPVSGRVGMRQVDAGNYVTPGDSAGIVVITQTRPISVIFNLPEDNLPAVLKRTHAGATLSVTAFDRSGATRLAEGSLVAIDNQIDPTTGTVRLRANFDNADEALFAGQFVNARLLVDTLPHAVVVPSSAVLHGTPGAYVYVVTDAPATAAAVTPDASASAPAPAPAPVAGDATAPAFAGTGSGTASVVAVRVVTLGPVAGDDVTILTGLAPGERVVVDGADKLKDGLAVTATMLGASGHGGHRGKRKDGTGDSATAASTATGASAADDGAGGSWHPSDGQGWPSPEGASATAPDDGTHPRHHRHHGATSADGSAGATSTDAGAGDGAPAADDGAGGSWHPSDGQGWSPDGASATAPDDGTHPHRHHHHGATAADGSAGATSADAGAGMSSP
jgi:multidrug efflux system membrane fusion protein